MARLEPENVFVNNMIKSFDSYSFKPNRVGIPVLLMDDFHAERLAETMFYIISSWENGYQHPSGGNPPPHIAEFGHFLMGGLRRWSLETQFPQQSILKE